MKTTTRGWFNVKYPYLLLEYIYKVNRCIYLYTVEMLAGISMPCNIKQITHTIDIDKGDI